MKSISCFLPYQDDTAIRSTVRQLSCSPLVEGEIHIKHKERIFSKDDGEYVDFEEIKE